MKEIKDTLVSAGHKLFEEYSKQNLFEGEIGKKLPKRSEISDIIYEIRRVLFPGYFGSENPAYVSLESFAGDRLAVIYEKLFKQIRTALIYSKSDIGNNTVEEHAQDLALSFIEKLPQIQKLLYKDVDAQLAGDPAAGSKEEVIFSYPGLYAIMVYRIAHQLYITNVPFIPRIMTEFAHSQTGIDINPGATIGEYFFIDHGTGIVIGETTEIGDNVKLYQGVTLGALSPAKGQVLSGKKRHPTIGNNVIVYANTTILGGDTHIGENSVIAGNTFVTQSIPANTKVSAFVPELVIQKRD